MDEKRALLRHTVATVAYRGGKAVRGVPASFAAFSGDDSARTAARDRSAGVFASAHAKDSNARQLFQVGNAVPGFAVDADAAAIEGEPTGW